MPQPSDTQIEVVHGFLVNHPRFAGVFRFYAGITHLHTPGIEGIIRGMVQTYKDGVKRYEHGRTSQVKDYECQPPVVHNYTVYYILNAHLLSVRSSFSKPLRK